jgi:hypothetical protein
MADRPCAVRPCGTPACVLSRRSIGMGRGLGDFVCRNNGTGRDGQRMREKTGTIFFLFCLFNQYLRNESNQFFLDLTLLIHVTLIDTTYKITSVQ